jgi:hypothetical protein
VTPQSLVINAPVTVAANFATCPVITAASQPPAPLPNATVGRAYSVSFGATGGSGSFTYSATGLPSWATFTIVAATLGLAIVTDTETITVTGTPSFPDMETSI